MSITKRGGSLRRLLTSRFSRVTRIGVLAAAVAGVLIVTPLSIANAEDASSDVSVTAAPNFKLPFPAGQVWSGQTRTNHSPQLSIDFNRANDEGDVVVASAPGTVSLVRDLGGTSYGKYVVIDHGGGWQTLYAHLQSWTVSVGQSVGYGSTIGYVGTTGGSTGPHLHYEQKSGGSAVAIYFDGVKALYYGTKNYTSTNTGGGNPYNPVTVCGAGYSVINSHALKSGSTLVGTIYLLYSNGSNCVVTMKETKVGTASAVSATLAVQGGDSGSDSGNFSYYAGPVKKSAPATCIKWGGSADGVSWTSDWAHCG